MIWLFLHPPPPSHQQVCLSFSFFLGLRSQIIRWRESLVLYKSFNTFCCTRTMMKKSYLTTIICSDAVSVYFYIYTQYSIQTRKLLDCDSCPSPRLINYHIVNIYILGQHVHWYSTQQNMPYSDTFLFVALTNALVSIQTVIQYICCKPCASSSPLGI
jgi:hypothetical protein